METTNTEVLMENKDYKLEEQLSQLFGSYKAEWLKEKLYELFTEPAYFPELKTSRPCMLVGGRGTGKTTVLRCLSYEGQFVLSQPDTVSIQEWSYYGMYYRVNTNRVTAFQGKEVDQGKWVVLFAHYFNLLLCDLLLKFLGWYHRHFPNATQLDENACSRVSKSFNLNGAKNFRELTSQIDDLRIQFEAHINNIGDNLPISLSIQGAPIDTLAESVSQLPQFKDKNFFFLLDEYENFIDYQQQVVNTLIKHAGQFYSFKIGVRELGWRCRTTLNENEQLIHPSDYVRINIAEKLTDEKFNDFALAVCNARVARVSINGEKVLTDISKLLPKLSEDEEAEMLGINELNISTNNAIQKLGISNIELNNLTPLQIYFIQFWATNHKLSLDAALQDFVNDRETWNVRYQNNKHALLYMLKKGKSGITKYYAGWNVFAKLAANNIRYLLELVDQSLILHLRKGGNLKDPISPETQTIAAQNAGKKNLSELEGLSVHGAKLTKLLLGLGRIYQVMAADPAGHTPELNQFQLQDTATFSNEKIVIEAEELVSSAVMHLALLRFQGSKLADETETKDYDYMVHPIFSPFFVFSYRRKRKFNLTSAQLLGLIKTPKDTIREILLQHNRSAEKDLPAQMLLFEGYYLDHS